MYAPHTVTLYYTVEDEVTFQQTNYITVLRGVLLDESKGYNVRASGIEGADAATLYIPFDVDADGKKYVSPKEFARAEDKSQLWTIDKGNNCFFVSGEAVWPESDFQHINLYFDNVYRVTKVDVKNFGSPSMRHFEVGGN